MAVHYGIQPKAIDELLKVFTQRGHSFIKQRNRVDSLLTQFMILPETEKGNHQLSTKALKRLNIEQDSVLINILQWIAFTSGDYSPAIISDGNADVWYGIPPNAFKSICNRIINKSELLYIQENSIDSLNLLLNQQVQKYKELRRSLAFREDKLARKAGYLLDDGRIEEAIRVMAGGYGLIKNSRKRYLLDEAISALWNAQTLEFEILNQKINPGNKNSVLLMLCNNFHMITFKTDLQFEGNYYEVIPFAKCLPDSKAVEFDPFLDSIALGYFYANKFNLALNFYKQANDQFVADSYEQKITLNNLGAINLVLEKNQEAIELFEQALNNDFYQDNSHLEQKKTIQRNLNFAYYKLGKSFNKSNKSVSNINFFKKALELSIIIQDTSSMLKNLYHLGLSLQLMEKYDSALKQFQKGMDIGGVYLANFKDEIESLPEKIKQHPEFDQWIGQNTIKRKLDWIEFAEAQCLFQLGYNKEAKEALEKVRQSAILRKDEALILEIDLSQTGN